MLQDGTPGQSRIYWTSTWSLVERRGVLTSTRDAEPGEFASDPDGQYNAAQNEEKYVSLFGAALATAGMPNHAIVDTGESFLLCDKKKTFCEIGAVSAQLLSIY